MQKAESALSFIPADDRDIWVMAGMAVRSEYGDIGFDIWDRWSRTSEKYNHLSAVSTWKSMRGSGVTISSLFAEAIKYGWRDSGEYQRPTQQQARAIALAREKKRKAEDARRSESARHAARKAGWILNQCKQDQHAYLDKKGFPDAVGMVWQQTEENNLLVIPMRVGRDVVGCQLIDREGNKKFLSGQVSSGAEYCIDSGGRDFYVEGYASGLSLREILSALKIRYRIHICFSAANLKNMARPGGFVIADNDKSGVGEDAAIATGLPYYLPETEGDDINDEHQRLGVFRLVMQFKKHLTH